MAAPTWLTRRDLEARLRAKVAAEDIPAAEAACAEAMAAVQVYCGRTFTGSEDNFAAVLGVAARLARDSFANNLDRTSFSGPEGLSFVPRPRILTGDEKSILNGFRKRSSMVGSARMGVAAWMTPDPD